jgi:subtilisin family serine protease
MLKNLKRIVLSVLFIAFLMVPANMSASDIPYEYEILFYETAKLVNENWCDSFIDRIVFTVDCPYMVVNGSQSEIFSAGTSPAVVDGMVMLPIRPLVEKANGDIFFDAGRIIIAAEQKIELEINSNEAVVDGNFEYIAAAPVMLDGRTMVCAFSAAEYLGFEADWNPETEQITLTRKFQTRRLVVYSHSYMDFSDLGAERIIRWFDNRTILQFATVLETRDAFEKLSAHENILWVEPDLVIFGFGDAEPLSWGVSPTGLDRYAQYLIGKEKTTETVIVAILDTGLDAAHPFFEGRIHSSGRCFVSLPQVNETDDWHWHGTHVSGTVVDGTPGLDNVKILPVRVLNENRGGSSVNAANAIRYAANQGARVINASWGTSGSPLSFQSAINHAVSLGAVVVVAAGNEGIDALGVTPANCDYVITVASNTEENSPSWFSNWGTPVDFSAPGSMINSTVPGGGFMSSSGTSMSAPHVSAAVAMYILNNPSLSPEEIRLALRNYVTVPDEWEFFLHGTGILNMDYAPRTFAVKFELNGGTLVSGELEQRILHGKNAIAPEITRDGWVFDYWDTDFSYVTEDIIVTAQWYEFGDNPPTGVGNVTMVLGLLIVLVVLSLGLWGVLVRGRVWGWQG